MTVSDDAKELVAAIRTQQRNLLVGSFGILVLLLAPEADEVLRRGQQELKKNKQLLEESLPGAIVAAGKADESDQGFSSELKDIMASTPEGRTNPEVLGYVAPKTLGDAVSIMEGHHFRCLPRVPQNVVSAFSAVVDGATPSVERMEFVAAHDADSRAAIARALDAATNLAMQLRKQPNHDAAPAASAAPPKFDLPEPPRTRTVREGIRMVVAENPQWERWNALKQEYAKARNAKERTEAQADFDRAATDEKRADFCTAIQSLEIAVQAQVPQTGHPQYLAASLVLSTPVCFEDTSVYLPVPCEQQPLLDPGTLQALLPHDPGQQMPPLLSNLRAGSQWPSLAQMDASTAIAVVDQLLIKSEGDVDVFGISVHRRLVFGIAPLALIALLLWHLEYLFRFRKQTHTEPSLEKLLDARPDVPARGNLLLPLAVFMAVFATCAALVVEAPKDDPYLRVIAGVPPLLSLIALIVASTIGGKKHTGADESRRDNEQGGS